MLIQKDYSVEINIENFNNRKSINIIFKLFNLLPDKIYKNISINTDFVYFDKEDLNQLEIVNYLNRLTVIPYKIIQDNTLYTRFTNLIKIYSFLNKT